MKTGGLELEPYPIGVTNQFKKTVSVIYLFVQHRTTAFYKSEYLYGKESFIFIFS